MQLQFQHFNSLWFVVFTKLINGYIFGIFYLFVMVLCALDPNYQAWLKICDSVFCTSFFIIFCVYLMMTPSALASII